MPTDKRLFEIESEAAHAAIELYLQTLHQKLKEIGEVDLMAALGKTSHVHTTLVGGDRQGVILFTIAYSESKEAINAVLRGAPRGVA